MARTATESLPANESLTSLLSTANMMLLFPLAQDEVFDSATIATNEDGKTMSGQGHEVGALTQFQIRETSFVPAPVSVCGALLLVSSDS
jgi:hypothetical protein